MNPAKAILIFAASLVMILPSSAQQVEEVMVQSASMDKAIPNIVITPGEYYNSATVFPVVYLLHGAEGNYEQWIEMKPELKDLATDYDIIIVCPDGGFTSWYMDSPVDSSMRYETYITEELVDFIDSTYRTEASRTGRAISGLSMGGHGALYLAIRNKDIFGTAGSTSGGVDFRPFPSGWDLAQRLGKYSKHPENWESNTVINLVDDLQDEELELMIDCGVDDFFYDVNEQLHHKLLDLDISHDYTTRPGGHEGEYWSNAIEYHLMFFNNYFDSFQIEE